MGSNPTFGSTFFAPYTSKPMATHAFLGIDCGTQSTKALLMEADTGRTVAVGRAEHQIVERPDGTREQDPAWWTDATVAAVRQSLQDAGPIEVAGISVSGSSMDWWRLTHPMRRSARQSCGTTQAPPARRRR